MTKFQYTAKQGPTKTIEGIIEADNLDNAISKVIHLGYSPLDVSPASESASETKSKMLQMPAFEWFRAVGLNDVAQFTRQMCDLIEASVPVLRSLALVAAQTHNHRFREIIEAMHNDVKDGGSLSSAAAKYPKVFTPFFTNLVRTGEVSGKLEVVMKRLADYLEKEQETYSKVRASLAYPSLILVIGLLTVFVLLSFVVPRLTMIFDDLGQDLPLPTIILVNLSSFFAAWWWAIILVVGIAIIYWGRWSRTEQGKMWGDQFILRLPVVGHAIRLVEVGRFARTMATLVETGVVITTALNSAWSTVQNAVLQQDLREISDQVTNGSSLRRALEASGFFPAMAVNMIAVGEETGGLDKSFYKIADIYEKQVDGQMKLLLTLLGPAVLVVIVAFVGFVVIALLLPVFRMNLIVQ